MPEIPAAPGALPRLPLVASPLITALTLPLGGALTIAGRGLLAAGRTFGRA